MKAHRNKSLILLLVLFFSLCFYFTTKQLNKESDTMELSNKTVADNQAFLKLFPGEWNASNGTNRLTFSKQNQVITIEFPTDNQTVHVTVSSQQPSRKRWLLSPTDGKETLYSVNLVSDNELSFQISSTEPNTEGTSKPESFYRVK